MAYATQTDLTNVGVPAQAITPLTQAQINAALDNASTFADSFFRARWGTNAVPLQAWDSAVTEAVAKIAAFRLLKVRGYSPGSGADRQFREGYDDAVAWLEKVQRQQAHPLVTLASNATPTVQPNLVSGSVIDLSNGARGTNRGW